MKKLLVLTVMADDRPGLVGQLSETIAGHAGNWEASRMARLAGRFAGILKVRVEPEREAELRTALAGLEDKGLRVLVDDGHVEGDEGGQRFLLHVVGNDRPGIIQRISTVLATLGANVMELTTDCHSAPMAGGELFDLSAELSLGDDSGDSLRAELEKMSADLMVDFAPLDRDA